MGARGFNVAQEGHVISILSPQNITGGVLATPFTLRDAAKCNIIIQFGAEAGPETKILLNACTDNTGSNPLPIAFDLFRQETSGNVNDVLGARLSVTSAGYTPPGTANTFYVIHLQADQMPQVAYGQLPYNWLQLAIPNGANADYASAVAILSGVRYQGESNQTATV